MLQKPQQLPFKVVEALCSSENEVVVVVVVVVVDVDLGLSL
jgi:hypothetical protein